jgi:hypothetical protein
MSQSQIRIPLDDETLHQLRELAASERRATADQAAVILARAMARRARQRTDRPKDPAT